ncbi:hypothetical protein [Ruminococcus albus]|uniref:hypothetical protein n=1 Tax=Ruminococcus albus TaxID=1264 RepID=UPI00046607FF|nr:hypothetical protein [Ruminococcus albus]
MNITLMKKASILAVIAVTALSTSACGDTKKNDESKKDTTSSAAAVEVITSDEEEKAPVESKAEADSKAEEKLEMMRAEISNNTGIDLYVIQILDKDGKCIADLLKDGAFLSTGFAQSFEIPSGEALTVRYGSDENTVYDVEKVNTSICSTIRLGLNINEPSVECLTKDGESLTVAGKPAEGISNENEPVVTTEPYYEEPDVDNNNNYNEEPVYNYEEPAVYDEQPSYDNQDQGGCVGDDAEVF